MIKNDNASKPIEVVLFSISGITAVIFSIFVYYFIRETILGGAGDSLFTARNGILSFMISFFCFYQANRIKRKRTGFASTANYVILSLYYLGSVMIVLTMAVLFVLSFVFYCLFWP